MKKLLTLFLVSSSILLDAQLLVVRINQQGYVEPLTDQIIKAHGKEIIEVLLKYTWPSCIAQDLTEDEKKELLSRNKFGAEQIFIRRKLQEISSELDVVFIPTTLYELFFIGFFFKTTNELCMSKQKSLDDFKERTKNIVKIIPILNQDISLVQNKILKAGLSKKVSPAQYVKKEINDEYNKFNKKVFEPVTPAIPNILVVHKRLVQDILLDFKLHKTTNFSLQKLQDAINNSIVNKSLTVAVFDFLTKTKEELDKNKNLGFNCPDIAEIFEKSKTLSPIWLSKIDFFEKIITIEYKAFEQNRGLLFRGSNPTKLQELLDYSKNKIIIGSAKYETTFNEFNNEKPFSLSFGNSLLAGIFYDWGASALNYLLQSGGYILYIDKLQYVDNYNSNLFFISPLIAEQALFGLGECFHSRSKPVIKEKKDKQYLIYGLLGSFGGGLVKDPYGIFLINRSQYRQAYLFSKYLSENGEVIGKPDSSKLLQEEQKGIELLKKNQAESTIEYNLKNLLENWKDRYLKIKNNKKLSGIKNKQLIKALELSRALIAKKNKKMSFIPTQKSSVQPVDQSLVTKSLTLSRAIVIKNKK